MKIAIYLAIHLVSLFLLTGLTFAAFANPAPELRKRTLALTGVFSLLILISGFGLLTVYGYGFPGWIIVKIIAWLGLSALGGMAYRMQGKAGTLTAVAAVLLFIGVIMVYFRPF